MRVNPVYFTGDLFFNLSPTETPPGLFHDMRRFFLPTLHWSVLPLLTAIYCVFFLNDPLWDFWRAITGAPHVAKLATAAFIFALIAVITSLLLPLAHPRLSKLWLALVIFIAAANDYFASHFGTIVDTSMIRNIMETDWREALELMTAPLGWHLLIYAGLPIAALIFLRLKPVTGWRWWWHMPLVTIVALLVGLGALGAQYKFFQLIFREHRELRLHINPTYAIYSLIKFGVEETSADKNVPLKTVALDARAPHRPDRTRPLLAVLVVGETARADHFSLNGYARPTNPELATIDTLLSFGDAWSCGTSTAESVPCMFSDLGRSQYSPDKAGDRENLLDILQRIGVDVLWIDNNSGSKGVARRVPQLGRKEFTAQEIEQHCNSEECFDDILLDTLTRALPATKGDRLIVLHQMGEHGPSYYRRHPDPFRQFQPECQQDDAFNCSNDALINAYDNDILYTDHVLANVIERMQSLAKTHDLLFFYMSDHGESLGENGAYLHGAPWLIAPDAQKHVPMLLWLSDQTYRDMHIDPACLRERAEEYADHDHIFHTFMGLFTDRKSTAYQRSLDVLAGCRPSRKAK